MPTAGVDVLARFGVGNVVPGMGGRRTGEVGEEGPKILSVTDGLSEGTPDCGDVVEESVSDEDEGEMVGSVLSLWLENKDIGPASALVGEKFTSEDQPLGEDRGSDMLLLSGDN